MFILIVSGGYSSKSNPLLGIFELDQAIALQNYGHKVILASIDLRSIRRKRKLGFSHLHQNGIEVYNFSFPLGRVSKQTSLWIGRLGIKKMFKKIIQKHGKPNIIHAHFTHIAAMSVTLKAKYNIPFVITEHSSHINKIKIDRKTKYFASNSYKYANTVIAVSSGLAQRIKQHFNMESVIIPNVVDTSIFKMSSEKNANFTFISVGSLIFGKGFDLLIDAFHQCNFEKNVSLLIIGDGIERKRLEKQIEDLELTEQIKLLGQLPREAVQQNISASSVFVLASRHETFGVVYIEAMAAGLPIIATRCGGPEDFVNETNGLLIDVDNKRQLITAFQFMYQNADKFDHKQIASDCCAKYSEEAIVNELSKVYDSILNKNMKS